ncbi:MAG TPA: hypothetical protein VEP89_02655 [Draconibacterium sp.]|nr:hypothetical protein [Draconibacterium sp.]
MNTESNLTNASIPTVDNTGKTDSGLELTYEIKTDLHKAGKWSQFLAIMGFIGCGFMVIAAIGMSIAMTFVPIMSTEFFPFPPYLFSLFYLLIAGIYFVPILYLFRFSISIKQAITLNNQSQLSKAFANLRAHYKTFGIIIIVLLCLYPILMVLMIVFGFMAGMGGNTGIPM